MNESDMKAMKVAMMIDAAHVEFRKQIAKAAEAAGVPERAMLIIAINVLAADVDEFEPIDEQIEFTDEEKLEYLKRLAEAKNEG